MTTPHDNKRIAKNTFILYGRQLFSLVISLATAGVTLRILGVEDFGTYNVVGGVISMFLIINGAMISSTQRYITFELGRGDKERLREVFGMSLSIHLIIAAGVFLISETVGLWMVNYELVIPEKSLFAANVVYQLSILSTMVGMTQIPYSASITAHERMDIYGIVGVLETIGRLIVLGLLTIIPMNKLILYALLIFVLTVSPSVYYRYYCVRHFEECRYRWRWNRSLFKEMSSFTGWNLFGSVAYLAKGNALDILINLFFGTTINAARAIATNIGGATNVFAGNFMMASRPQIIKSYAAGEDQAFQLLVFRSSKFAFYLVALLAIPVLLDLNYILHLWFGDVPQYTLVFCQLTIIDTLINCFSFPLITAANATGRIKTYQAVVGSILILNAPIAYLCLKLGSEPTSVYYTTLSISAVSLLVRLVMLKFLVNFSVKNYLADVIARGWLLFVVAFFPMNYLLSHFDSSIYKLIFGSTLSVLFTSTLLFFGGLMPNERAFIVQTVRAKIKFLN